MSKVDAQRAMREARYAARAARGPSATRPAAPPPPAAPVLDPGPPPLAAPVLDPEVPVAPARPEPAERERPVTSTAGTVADAVEVCGHRNMGNKSCRRPAGHAEKSHRYR